MRTLARAVAFALVCAPLTLTACSKKPSVEQCEAFADHFVGLLEASRESPSARIKKLAQSQRDKLVDSCAQDGTVKEVECVLAQSSIADVEANCK
jgi:hypothetical protein